MIILTSIIVAHSASSWIFIFVDPVRVVDVMSFRLSRSCSNWLHLEPSLPSKWSSLVRQVKEEVARSSSRLPAGADVSWWMQLWFVRFVDAQKSWRFRLHVCDYGTRRVIRGVVSPCCPCLTRNIDEQINQDRQLTNNQERLLSSKPRMTVDKIFYVWRTVLEDEDKDKDQDKRRYNKNNPFYVLTYYCQHHVCV